MRVADGVVGHLQALEQVHRTARPNAAIAVLVAGEILDDRRRLRTVRISGIGKGNIPADGEMAIGPRAAVHNETVKVRMGGIALELLDLHSTRQVALLMSVPANAPVGCSGMAYQKPVASEPAATLSTKVLSGLVIQNVDTLLSEGIRISLASWPVSTKFLPPVDPNGARLVPTHGASGWHLVRIPRLCTNWLPCSTASSRKK